MNDEKRILTIINRMKDVYGDEIICYLDHETPFQLLIAVILSAQCTDKRVNIVTKELFKKYPDAEAFAKADLKELEDDIKPTGFFHNKAQNIINASRRIIDVFNGEVPRELDELLSLPGVGRKTANVIRGQVYGEPSIVVDTHVKRVSKRLALTEEDDPTKVEFDLMKKLPRESWILVNIHFIALGRSFCDARKPRCEECFLSDICKTNKKLSI